MRVGVYVCVGGCVQVYYENATNYSRIKVIINFSQTLVLTIILEFMRSFMQALAQGIPGSCQS